MNSQAQRRPSKSAKTHIAGQPGFFTMMRHALTKGCPVCGKRRQFTRWLLMTDDCARCGLHFERIEGHWIGAIGINTIVGFGTLLIYLIVGLIVSFPDPSVLALSAGGVLVSILVPTVFYPFSKTIWTAIDIAMRPLEPHEVDWAVLNPSTRSHRESSSSDD